MAPKRTTTSGRRRHVSAAAPALLKTTFHCFAARAKPAPLRQILKTLQQCLGLRLFMVVGQPDFWLTLVGRQFPGHTAEKIALHRGRKASLLQHVGPKRCNGNVGRTGESEHSASLVLY